MNNPDYAAKDVVVPGLGGRGRTACGGSAGNSNCPVGRCIVLFPPDSGTALVHQISDVTIVIRRLCGRASLSAAFCLSLLALVGVALRVSVRDSFQPVAWMYYGLPVPVVVAACAVAGFLFRRLRWLRMARALTVAGIGCAAWWCVESWQWHEPLEVRSAMRAMCWNVARGTFGWQAIASHVRSQDADFVGLIESGPKTAEMLEFWEKMFPGHDIHQYGGGLTTISRFPVEDFSLVPLSWLGCCASCRVITADGPVRVAVVDIRSNPLVPREGALKALQDFADQHSNTPLLVMGDLNTPVDSHHIRRLRTNMQNVFEMRGRGFDLTWPVPCPVLSIDQMWVNRFLEPASTRLTWSWTSDHRAVLAELSVVHSRVAAAR